MSGAPTGGHPDRAPWWDQGWLMQTLFLAVVATGITGLISVLWPKTYRAEAKILPNQTGSVASSLIGLAAASGFGDLVSDQLGNRENPILTYPEILSSRSLLEKIAFSPYPPDSSRPGGTVMGSLGIRETDRLGVDKGIRRLGEITRIEANLRNGLVYVSAVTRDSVLSAYIVEQMLAQLDHFNVDTRSSRGRATREFLDARIKDARRELTEAEGALAMFRQTNVRIGNSPQLQLEQARLEREVDTRAELYRMLAREFEAARIEEKQDTPTFTVVDPAKPPVRKYRPKVLLNVLLALLCVVGARILVARIRLSQFRHVRLSEP